MGLRGPVAKINHQAFAGGLPDTFYWSGIMATEGNICFGKGRSVPLIRYGCKVDDIAHVYKFKEFLQSGNKVSVSTHHTAIGDCTTATLAFTSEEIGEFLMKNGIGPKKSLTLCLSQYLADSPHTWRGAVDGDGTVCIPSAGITSATLRLVSGSRDFIEQFVEFCYKNINYRPNVGTAVRGNSLGEKPGYYVAMGNAHMRDMVKLLYGGDVTALDRKKAKAEIIIGHLVRKYEHSGLSVVRTAVQI
jgi:hypothetical protein